MVSGITIQGLDAIDIIGFIGKKNRKFQALFLKDLEEVLSPKSSEYRLVRKMFLDTFNDYTRSVLRVIFGDIESLNK